MKKFILVLGLLLSSVVFANTAKCRAIIEKFLEQGMYIMVYSKIGARKPLPLGGG